MNWYRTSALDSVRFIVGESVLPYYNAAMKIARAGGITILRDKELFAAALSGRQVIGAAWESWQGNDYSFDVAVDKAWQNRGVGGKLSDLCIREFDEIKEAYGEEARMHIHVVNPIMEHVLQNRGFTKDPTMNGIFYARQ